MDILFYDAATGLHYKAVVKSPVLSLAEKAQSLSGNLLITGTEMGGGAISKVLIERAREAEVIMSDSAAATVHHNPERVRSYGIKVVEDTEAETLRDNKNYTHLTIGDIQLSRLERIIDGVGIAFAFDVVGICAQDHGIPPKGVSHLDYRHDIFKASLDRSPYPHALLYRNDEVPGTLNRLRAIVESAEKLPSDEIYVMDSGMAAILGASMDAQVGSKVRIMILDIATSHTVGAAIEKGQIAGFFEYHTQDITLEKIEKLLPDLADGKLVHRKILQEGGHGAYILKAFGFKSAEVILATGPKRRLIQNSRLPIVPGAPLGDNMMTGTVGVFEAIRRRKGLNPLSYW
jgi:uncharacterized protein (DUF1786 family)